jgi:hypothetical protein
MLISPIFVLLALYLFIYFAPIACVPVVLHPIKEGEAWRMFWKSSLLEPNSCNSFSAALITLIAASLDLISNFQLVVLLYPEAPNSIYIVQCVSIVVTVLVDISFCWFKFGIVNFDNRPECFSISPFSHLWLYILECQELDPVWQKFVDRSEGVEVDKQSAVSNIRIFKMVKFMSNTLPSYYVQVNCHQVIQFIKFYDPFS